LKSKKNKLTNLLKTGILFFGISLLLYNCATENEPIVNNQSYLLEKLQSNFNVENLKEALPYDFEVQWTHSLKQYSEELETSYYEFPIIYTSKFNPDEIQKGKSQKRKYSISYKLLVTESEAQTYKYYILKFYQEESKNSSVLGNSFVGKSNFTGFTHLLDDTGEIVFAKKFEKGIEDHKKFYNKEFKEKRNKDENIYAKVDETCTTVTTYQYTDNYVKWGNGAAIYVSTTFNGSYTTTSCESYWIPDLSTGGGGGSGLYKNNGDAGVYNNCKTPSCRYQIRDMALECGQGSVYDAILEKCVEYQIFNELTGKDLCVFNELKKLGLFKSTIGKFSNGNYDLTLKSWTQDACKNSSDDGCTDANDLANGNITIYIQNTQHGTLDLAATILHEGIHAELYKYVDEHKQGIDPNNRENILEYYFAYKVDNGGNRFATSNAQHQHMADAYITPIAKALRQLDNYKYPTKDYLSLAWNGLRAYGIKDPSGVEGYFENGEWTTLDSDKSYEGMSKILKNTKFNKDCK